MATYKQALYQVHNTNKVHHFKNILFNRHIMGFFDDLKLEIPLKAHVKCSLRAQTDY